VRRLRTRVPRAPKMTAKTSQLFFLTPNAPNQSHRSECQVIWIFLDSC
jgi:hypothetical protein